MSTPNVCMIEGYIWCCRWMNNLVLSYLEPNTNCHIIHIKHVTAPMFMGKINVSYCWYIENIIGVAFFSNFYMILGVPKNISGMVVSE